MSKTKTPAAAASVATNGKNTPVAPVKNVQGPKNVAPLKNAPAAPSNAPVVIGPAGNTLNIPADQIDKIVEISAVFLKPWIIASMSLFGSLLMGLLASLITGIFVKRAPLDAAAV